MLQLQLVRISQGMSQKDLAEKSGIHNTTLSRIENGHAPLSVPYAEKAARALGWQGCPLFLALDVEITPL